MKRRTGDRHGPRPEGETGPSPASRGSSPRVRTLTRGLALSLLATAAGLALMVEGPVPEAAAPAECEGLPGHVRALAFRPDGRTVAACTSDGSLVHWAPGPGRARVVAHGGDVRAAIAPDGSAMAVEDRHGVVAVYDGATGRRRGDIGAPAGRLWALALSRDGTLLASADDDGVRTWEAATGRPAGPRLPRRGVACLAFGPGGRVLAAGGRDGTIRLLDAAGGGPAREEHWNRKPAQGVATSLSAGVLGFSDPLQKVRGLVRSAK
jgi:WD40 repeat protein